MEIIADLHIHSPYAMACSKNITLEAINNSAVDKGIRVIGTGDFTHPRWMHEIKDKLVEGKHGLYRLKGYEAKTDFILTSEVSTIFTKGARQRKIHNCILAPSIEVVEQVNAALKRFGSLESDGRPQLGMSAAELVEILHGIDKRIIVFPAHAWTPWFGVFGSLSGFDSMKDAYEDQEMHIHALETGLSSDPIMNWRISSLDKYTLLSNSDAHSVQKIGREANVFDIPEDKLSYGEISNAIIGKDVKKIKMTVEFYPEEGKYHFDGHRNCSFSSSPERSAKYNNVCPVCGKRLTLGVLHRINELADRPEGYIPANAIPYVHAVPLIEVLSYMMKKPETAVGVKGAYMKLIERFGSEFNVLLKSDINSIGNVDKELGQAIRRIRDEEVNLIPGYDGIFGIVDIMNREKPKKIATQKSISDY